jgi:hypothetical protein
MYNTPPPYKPQRISWNNNASKLLELIHETRESYSKKGLVHVLKTGFFMMIEYFQLLFYKIFRNKETFGLNSKRYKYFFHPRIAKTGPSWKNERSVSIPIIWEIIKEYRSKGKNVLELGNVLSYTFKIDHDVIDKYEMMDGVINEDIISFAPKKKYDLIVSVLSFQCVGWDESPQDPPKIVKAIENMKEILVPGGKIFMAIGWGWNQYLDKLILDGKFHLDKQLYLKKDKGYHWKEVPSLTDIKNLEYDNKMHTATGIIIATIEKKENEK